MDLMGKSSILNLCPSIVDSQSGLGSPMVKMCVIIIFEQVKNSIPYFVLSARSPMCLRSFQINCLSGGNIGVGFNRTTVGKMGILIIKMHLKICCKWFIVLVVHAFPK